MFATGIDRKYVDLGAQAIRDGKSWRGHPGGRSRQSLDGRGGGLQGTASLQPIRWSASLLLGSAPRQESQDEPRKHGGSVPHVVTTSYLTDGPIREQLSAHQNFGFDGPLYVSTGQSIGLRMVPMVRDLRFLWEETPQQVLDEQQQKVRESLRQALIQWAQQAGRGE